MNCPGSIGLLKHLSLPETDEPDYRTDGIAAHEAAAHALVKGLEAWELAGLEFHGVKIDEGTATAIDKYLVECRSLIEPDDIMLIEQRVQFVEHPMGYGTCDFARFRPSTCELVLRDYKHGEGIVVDAEWNPQLMYYAHPLIQRFPDCRKVDLGIVQPRAWHELGPIRTWDTNADEIEQWVNDDLLPKMSSVEMDNTLDPGHWCRFCPAKLVCPMLTSLFGAAAKADPALIPNMNPATAGRSYQYVKAVEFYCKALKDHCYTLGMRGTPAPGTKIVAKKADRVWKDKAADVLKARLGDAIYTAPEIKSPAQIEKIGADARKLVAEWAYTPQTGLTIAAESDKRPAVRVETTTEKFAAALAHIQS